MATERSIEYSLSPGLTLDNPEASKTIKFNDCYELDQRLASGSYGTVYITKPKNKIESGSDDEAPPSLSNEQPHRASIKARRSSVFAVKVVDRTKLKPKDDQGVFREVGILRELKNVKHVVRLIDFFEEPNVLYVVQVYAEGGDVFDRLGQKTMYTELDARDVAKILLETIDILHSEHRIVHRDLKPENLLLGNMIDDTSILLADFGFAKHIGKEEKLSTRCGTPAFVAPEILLGKPYDFRVDVWSVGCILYMLLGGYPPFQAKNHKDLFRKIRAGDYVFHNEYWKNVSVEAKQLISQLLVVNPDDRWTTQEALQSTWVRIADESLSSNDLTSSLDSIRSFNDVQKESKKGLQGFKSAVHAVQWAVRAKFFNPDSVSFAKQMKRWDDLSHPPPNATNSTNNAADKPLSPQIAPKPTFKETYELQSKIRKGSFATVWKAINRNTKQVVAVKVIPRADLKSNDDEAVLNEVAIMQSLQVDDKNHQFIVELIDFYEEEDCFYMILEYMAGGDVFDRIVEVQKYTEKDARDLARVLLQAVAFLHDHGIAHRDLKPQNLLLTTPDDGSRVKLADFGFSRRVHTPQSLTTRCGTPTYVAPEILKNIPHDCRADMWSVGVCIFVLLVGYPPFMETEQPELFRKIRSSEWTFDKTDWAPISDNAKELIRGLLVVDPFRRWTAKDALRCSWFVEQRDDALMSRVLSESQMLLKTDSNRLRKLARVFTWFAQAKDKTTNRATVEEEHKESSIPQSPSAT